MANEKKKKNGEQFLQLQRKCWQQVHLFMLQICPGSRMTFHTHTHTQNHADRAKRSISTDSQHQQATG